jgi:hypothetical protein
MSSKYGYIGYGPDTSPVVVAKQVFSPTGVQTNFTFAAGYQIGYLDVYLNGARQIEGQDFSATDTSTVVLSTAAQSGDILELVAYKAYNLATPSSVGSFSVGGNLVVTGNESVSTLVATTAIGIGSTLTTSSILPYPLTITASGSTPTPALSFCIADISSNQNGYSQFNLRNTNTGYNASGDLVITTDNGTDTTNFIDLGINNTGFSTTTWTVNGALDGYLYSSNTNLSVGVAFTNRYLSFFAGGTLAANEKIRITDTGVGIGTTNTSNTLQVGTAITMYGSTGIISATSFSGSGANLTGISSVSFATTAYGLTGNPAILVSSAGINTTITPSTKLYVSGNAASNIVGLGSTNATTTLDFSQGNNFSLTLSGNIILANPTGVTTGQSGIIFVSQSSGSNTIGFGSAWDFPSATAPTLSSGASALDCLTYFVRNTNSIITNSLIGIGTL